MHVVSAPAARPATTSLCKPPTSSKAQRCPAAAARAGAARAQVTPRQRQRAVAARAADQQQQQLEPAPAVEDSTVAGDEDESQEDEEEWVEVGKIGPPHGVRGEMKVQPLTDFPEDRLGTPGPRWIQAPAPKMGRRQAAELEEVELEWGRSMISKGNEVWLVKLEDIESPEEAALLRGHMLLVPASARPPLDDDDEFYVQDLVGLKVFMQANGEELGHVSDVFDGTGTHDLLRIQLAASQLERLAALAALQGSQDSGGPSSSKEEGGEEAEGGPTAAAPRHFLMPFAKEMVPVVDVAGGRMEVTPPEGLLELATPSSVRRQRKENRGQRERRRTRPKGQSAAKSGAEDSDASDGGSSSSNGSSAQSD
ncbi:Ribosome maturation factor RimM [Chlorella vulgaris]